MRKNLFAIPIFEDKVDLDKIVISDENLKETWDCQLKTTYFEQHEVPQDTWDYLGHIITKNINDIDCRYHHPRIENLWVNVYEKTDFQEPHIHSHCQWSFIIYQTVSSKTVFFNPSFKDIQNQIGNDVPDFPLDYKPQLEPGSIIIFPSFLLHMVIQGNEGTTIAGNVRLEYD